MTADITLIASDATQIDPVAVEQLHATAKLPGIQRVVGLPDLHAGRGIAVGAAFWSPDDIYPHLVGSDIGCGMALHETSLPARKFRLDKADRQLVGLDDPVDHDGLGTIGGGNHFAEFLRIETVEDALRFAELGFDPDCLWLLVHSGSRGLGQAILDQHVARHGTAGLEADSEEARTYVAAHDGAVEWAIRNRAVIAGRFCDALGITGQRRLDICHNSATPHQGGWLHRKGAAPADRGLVVVPGSRGDFSYLVEPIVENADSALHSLAHGAGRKWSRSTAFAKLSKRFRLAELERTALGSRVICEDRQLIFEEAPEAYKDIHRVVGDLRDAGLIRIIAKLRPLLSYKKRRA